VPEEIVLYITDFCPKNHSANQSSGHCQGPQLDISASAFLLLGRRVNGYIDSRLDYSVELLEEDDPTYVGPHW
jgi:hypothetical protein